jgi:TPR repeat protein
MSNSRDEAFGLDTTMPSGRRRVPGRIRRALFAAAAAVALSVLAGDFAEAATFRQGVSAFNRQDYLLAAQNFFPLAEQGDPAAQSYLGFMFETGRGVPRNYTEAAMWYRRAAEQGDTLAQYSLGLLYDKGQGVPQDIVEANKWLNLSAAAAPRGAREARARLRDAVTTKMTRGEIARSRLRALEWVPTRER